jgi:hypothetical protein
MVELISSGAVEEGLPMRARRPGVVFGSRHGASCLTPALAVLSLAAGLLGALGVAGAELAATPAGSEFQVNTYTTD